MKCRDPAWNCFILVESTADCNKKIAKCKQCEVSVSPKIERLKAHLKKCIHAIQELKPTTKRAAVIDDDIDVQPLPKKLCQPQMINYSIKTDNTFKAKLDDQIAKFFYACNIPFNVAEHPQWLKMIELLRPGYLPPNRKALAGPLLEKTHGEIELNMQEDLHQKEVTLIQDGWSDIHNTPVIASSIHAEDKSYFLSAEQTGANKKTKEYCATIALDAINQCKTKYNCNVKGLVTDNEKKMVAMRTILKEEKPDIIVYGCASHWCNLLGQDITPASVIKQVVEVNKFFRNHHIPNSLLSDITGSVKPQLPNETRWNSQIECCKSYIRNRPYMMLICAQNEEEIEPRIRTIINNIGLFNEVKSLVEQLSPIAQALDKLQSDKSSIADACEEFCGLQANPVLEPYKDTVKRRFDQAMTPSHFLANLLHPKYRGQRLTSTQIDEAQQLVINDVPTVIPELLRYQLDDLVLPKVLSLSRETLSFQIWWKSAKQSESISKELCDIAIKLSNLPASSASVERIFSNFGLIQTKLRNRLGISKASKLVACYRFLRGSHDLDW